MTSTQSTTTATHTDDSLTVTRVYDAPVERVWQAWTDPALLTRWYCPNPDRGLHVETDVRVGGSWMVDMGGDIARGRYTEVDEPRRLAFTWQWDGAEETTQVLVELAEKAGRTQVRLTHSGFARADEARGHAEGWSLSFDRLPDVL